MNILSQALPLKPFLNCFQMVKKIPQINVYIRMFLSMSELSKWKILLQVCFTP